MNKIEMLKSYIESNGEKVVNIKNHDWYENYIEVETELESMDFMVLTEDEAFQQTKDYILETLWAFNTEFINEHLKTKMDVKGVQCLKKIQGEICESCNDLISSMIENLDLFVANAIDEDGRGHFLSDYDGEEIELTEDGYIEFYAYRTN